MVNYAIRTKTYVWARTWCVIDYVLYAIISWYVYFMESVAYQMIRFFLFNTRVYFSISLNFSVGIWKKNRNRSKWRFIMSVLVLKVAALNRHLKVNKQNTFDSAFRASLYYFEIKKNQLTIPSLKWNVIFL